MNEHLTEQTVKTLLAKRLLRHSKRCDETRESLKHAYSPEDIYQHSRRLSERLSAIDELQEVWERLFGNTPTLAEVHQHATHEEN
ncbi:hypothetical protein [Terracoccus sp. 273MFTsu3.1]|uniref:hypothetical protein n=1 Tax=Terracoccus sp. 273MFTsu3.1 TaxID=1172188 RepID=UPI00037E9394|nr:hypothetical protein [Terracoccus sp. 273MFTsu3.1]